MRPSLLRPAAILAGLGLIAGAALIASGTGQPAAAAKPPAPKRECFDKDFVSGFSAPNEDTVYVTVGAHEVWRLDLATSCPDVDFRQRVGLKTHGSPWVCSGLDVEVVAPSSVGPNRCMVRSIHKMTQAEIDALPKKDRP